MAAAMGSPPGDLPVKKSANGFVGLDDLAVSGPVRHLLEYLRAEGRILDLTE